MRSEMHEAYHYAILSDPCRYFLSVRSKYLSQQPLLENSNPILTPVCERPTFIPT
jgi:hypothetical protein